ncbi:Riboflavin synthase [Acetobacteraceae bacterium EV16G]|uniref:Riboflavin synthase n=1 Tax=Sorlinia euscelidii TaxID=3081148 RepID=A0ABU7U0B6_9PROT
MFSGIIENLGSVLSVTSKPDARIFTIETGFPDLSLGESIAVNGVCLTVTAFQPDGQATFFVSTETLSRSSLGAVAQGHYVNLERACTPTTRLSGHIVQGHVDAVGNINRLDQTGDVYDLRVSIPESLRRYVVEKGSIALDGISLTVNHVGKGPQDAAEMALMIIPHTWQHTALSEKQVGDPLNIEVDILAKYIESLTRHGATL